MSTFRFTGCAVVLRSLGQILKRSNRTNCQPHLWFLIRPFTSASLTPASLFKNNCYGQVQLLRDPQYG